MEPLSKEVFFLNYGAMNTMIAVDFYFTILLMEALIKI